jgi:hypothetical protein
MSLGLNRLVHFPTGDYDKWNAIGDHLVQNQVWDGVLNMAGMRELTVWAARPDNHSGRLQLRIESSASIKFGIFVAHNDHFGLTDIESPLTSKKESIDRKDLDDAELSEKKVPVAIKILADEWGSFMRRSEALRCLIRP